MILKLGNHIINTHWLISAEYINQPVENDEPALLIYMHDEKAANQIIALRGEEATNAFEALSRITGGIGPRARKEQVSKQQ